MVKLQDGSNVFARDLLLGEGQDDEGKKLTFEQVQAPGDNIIPTIYEAQTQMNDGSGRTRFFRFNLADTLVRVEVTTTTKEEIITK